MLVLFASIGLHGQTDPGLVFNDITRTYGDEPFDLGASSSAGSGGAITYTIVGSTNVISLDGNIATIHNAGTVSVRASIAQWGNYGPDNDTATITVSKMEVKVKAWDDSLTYGTRFWSGEKYDILPVNEYEVPKEDLAPYLSVYCINHPDAFGPRIDVGEETIRVRIDSLPPNYQVLEPTIDGLLTVHPKTIQFRINSVEREYGIPNPEPTGESDGFVGGQDVSVLDPKPQYVCNVDSSFEVGEYPITLKFTTHDDWNYILVPDTGTLTIKKAPITISPIDTTVFYGDAENTTYSWSAPWRIPWQDSLDFTEKPVLAATATDTTSVNTPDLFVMVQNAVKHKNYIVTPGFGNLNIDPAPLDVSVRNVDVKYKDPIPDPAYEVGVDIDGFKNGEDYHELEQAPDLEYDPDIGIFGSVLDLSYEGNPIQGDSADNDPYPIKTNKTALSARNYKFNYLDGLLTIIKADLRINIHDINKFFGDPDPPLAHDITEPRPSSEHKVNPGELDFDINGYSVNKVLHDNPGEYLIYYDDKPSDNNYEVYSDTGIFTVYESAHLEHEDSIRACRDSIGSLIMSAGVPGPIYSYKWEVLFPGYDTLEFDSTSIIVDTLLLSGFFTGQPRIRAMKKSFNGYEFFCTLSSSIQEDEDVDTSEVVMTTDSTRRFIIDLYDQPYVTKVENKEGILLICRDYTADTYQWTLDEDLLPGETRQYLDISATPDLASRYWVQTTWDIPGHCITKSNTTSKDSTGFIPPEDYSNLPESFNISISPNPIEYGKEIIIDLEKLDRLPYTIMFFDQNGKKSSKMISRESPVDQEKFEIKESEFPSGINFVVVTQGHRRDVKAFIVHD